MENLNLRADAVKHTCSLSIRAHSSPPFVLDGAFDPSLAIFAFAGSSGPNSDDDGWFSGEEGGSLFGEVEIDSSICPSLRGVGSDEAASVYGAFQSRFKRILNDSSLEHEVLFRIRSSIRLC
ncbi:hypothetical protein QJS10_CPA10g01702 [Acorus calamus]|uniref:Uncharacterized protein n=1 Tax=Acorus calamus TaxID=4465 RepID=A0AAV9E3I5_ACOCL|nr:hypothetical protein QJS10_CPA10g01702 [Acorus calamus]